MNNRELTTQIRFVKDFKTNKEGDVAVVSTEQAIKLVSSRYADYTSLTTVAPHRTMNLRMIKKG